MDIYVRVVAGLLSRLPNIMLLIRCRAKISWPSWDRQLSSSSISMDTSLNILNIMQFIQCHRCRVVLDLSSCGSHRWHHIYLPLEATIFLGSPTWFSSPTFSKS